MSEDDNSQNWHLSKTVPVSIIFALLIQAAGSVWYASQMSAAIYGNQMKLVDIIDNQKDKEDRIRIIENTLARADERFTNILGLLNKIDGRLERFENGK